MYRCRGLSEVDSDGLAPLLLRFHGADDGCLRVTPGPQLFDTGFRALFRYAGKQSTGGLGIEQQREGRCSRRQSKVPNGSLQPQVLRLQRALDSGAGGLDGPFQERNGGQ